MLGDGNREAKNKLPVRNGWYLNVSLGLGGGVCEISKPGLGGSGSEELREAKEKKEFNIQQAKDAQETEKNRKAATAQHHIAKVEDDRALDQARRQSLRPDLDLEKNIRAKSQLTPNSKVVVPLQSTSQARGKKKAETQIEVSPDPEIPDLPPAEDGTDFQSNGLSESDFVSGMDVGDNEDFELDEGDNIIIDNHSEPEGSEGSVQAGMDSDGEDSDFNMAAAIAEIQETRRKLKEQKKKSAAEKKKANKTAIRDAVSTKRSNPPAPIDVVKLSGASKRRASTASENVGAKRSKGAEIGGLRSDWAKVSQNMKAAASNTSLVSSDAFLEAELSGEFDGEEPGEMTTIARASKELKSKAKTSKKAESKTVGEVRLVPADVNVIDVKERGKSATAVGKKPKPSKSDLPLNSSSDAREWKDVYLPAIFDFVGAQEFQYGMSTNVDLKFFIKETWAKVFPSYKGSKDHPALIPTVHDLIRTYRSEIGKRTIKVVEKRLEELDTDNLETRKLYIQTELDNDSWIFANVGSTRATSSGAMRGPGILEVFAYHRETTKLSSRKPSRGFPAGALALSAAAYERALEAFKPGYNNISEARKVLNDERKKDGKGYASKNNGESFGEARWADRMAAYYKLVRNLSDAKWQTIYSDTQPYVNIRKAALLPTVSTSDNEVAESSKDIDAIVVSD